jgi:UDP-N-acetyl-D-mannosaminuronic acid dehydrogenase
VTEVLEAELIKLFSNSWRYVNFAISNQFYMISTQFGLNYNQLRKKMIDGYDRNKNIPSAGLTAGPCLLKDTMQLTTFSQNQFTLGHDAMLINEGFPNFIVNLIKKEKNISRKKIGLLGLTFKADVDDIRDSLSFKLIKLFNFNGFNFLLSDEYYKHRDNVKKEILIKNSDIIVLAVPHTKYKKCIIPKNKTVIDIWGFFEKK